MLFISQLLLILTIIGAAIVSKTIDKRKLKPVYVVVLGVFLSVLAANIFIDMSNQFYADNEGVFLCLLHSVQVMLAGYEFEMLYEQMHFDINIYFYLAFLFSVAPICTFSFVLSFFEKFTSYVRYILNRRKNVYIMSEINEKTLSLAASVKKDDARSLIVFMSADEDETLYEIKNTGAIFFGKKIKNIFAAHMPRKCKLSFFIMGDNESQNLSEALVLTKKFKNRKNTEIYVLSSSKVGGLLLDSADKGMLKVRRINEGMQLAYSQMCNSSPVKSLVQNENQKKISILIVGMGGYGTEFLKTALWCGQLPGFTLEINVIDKRENIKSLFYEMCPEIIEKEGNREVGESIYSLNFYPGVDVNTHEFEEITATLSDTTLVFVSLGSDEINIETAITLRTQMTRMGICPLIKSVVYSNEKNRLLRGRSLTNYKNQNYDIMFIGSIDESFSYSSVTGKQFEENALIHHLSYYELNAQKRARSEGGDYEKIWEEEKENALSSFNSYEYFRNSSIATTLYRAYFNKNEYSPDEKKTNAIYEHMRWNAYMRVNGYVYGKERNDLAKTHPDLVAYSMLSTEDIDKDFKMVDTKIKRE